MMHSTHRASLCTRPGRFRATEMEVVLQSSGTGWPRNGDRFARTHPHTSGSHSRLRTPTSAGCALLGRCRVVFGRFGVGCSVISFADDAG